MKVLIIANARWIPGLSGSDIIYLNFKKHWPCEVDVWEMLDVDFKPFSVCYIWRIVSGCFKALNCRTKYEFVYSASDFWMDSIPAFIMKLKGMKWVAGFYLYAPRCKPIYYFLQRIVHFIIMKFADIVCVTNGSMVYGFKGKKTIEVNGGVDLTLAGYDNRPKIYDAVFCGRIHPSKGIDELIQIWRLVRKEKPDARLALIGDYDLGVKYVKRLIMNEDLGIDVLGYLGDERFDIYKQSKVVLYPARWDHFSMSPVEAMACGCPMVAFDLPVMEKVLRKECGVLLAENIKSFSNLILYFLIRNEYRIDNGKDAIEWANTWDWKITTRKVYDQITKGVA
jgi:glycosyltransferase involved in cell wall biosynthesis